MYQWSNDNAASSVFIDTSDISELRAKRVWRLVVVLWLTWIFFTFFFWYRGYEFATTLCAIDSIVHLVILIACWNLKNYHFIAHVNLAASGFGLFFVSLCHPSLAVTMWFFPGSILVSSQLLGVRDASRWLVISLFTYVAFFGVQHGWDVLSTSKLDELTLMMGVAVCIFFCCHQGEEYYQLRTQNLMDLSQGLQRKSEVLQELATTDALTGIMNRFRFQERLKECVEEANKGVARTALFLVDMDGFKEINDTLGHPVGDDALVMIATRLKAEFAASSEVARLGGDEFCIIHNDVRDAEHAASIAHKICRLLTQRYVLDDAEFPLGASVGYAICPDHTQSAEELLAFADTAMYQAKETRAGHLCYEADMTNRLVEYRTMQEKLSFALERNEFFLVYQPQVDLRTGVVIGVEALLRWRNGGEVIPPFRFIPLLEQSREIIPVSNWIIKECCRQLAIWEADGHDIEISINISAVQFKDPDFCGSVTKSIGAFDVSATKLDFEITEGLLIDDVGLAVERLNQFKEMGVSISIDDFGTGYSSLAYLRQFPIDRLKIDRAFVKDIPDNDDGVIAASIIVLAKSLDLKVLAEGVETAEQLQFLQDHDCDEYQGYFLSPPVEASEVVKFFTSKHDPQKLVSST